MHFFIAYFLSEISKFAAETSHIVNDSRLFTETRFNKTKFAQFNHFATQNGGFKARSHSVRKAN